MALVDTAAGGFIEKKGRDWKPIVTAPQDGTIIDVWLTIHASPMSMGIGDSFGVPDAWFEKGKWMHTYRGNPTELEKSYVTHWRPKKTTRATVVGVISDSGRNRQMTDLPTPRLQFRWRRPTKAELRSKQALWGQENWTCVYELVMPLREFDMRRGAKDISDIAIKLGRTFMSTGRPTTPTDAPFRDGPHARWDSEALGGIPVYVIDGNGDPHLQPNKSSSGC